MDKHLSRRGFLAGAAAGLAGALLAACQPNVVEVTKVVEKQVTQVIKETVMVAGTPQVVEKVITATPPPAKPKEIDKGPLYIMWGAQTALVNNFREYSEKKFTPANNGAKVEILEVPGGEFAQKLLSGFASGNPPDLFRDVNYSSFQNYCMQGVILALDDLIARDNYQTHLATFLPGSLDAGKYKGKQYSIPFGGHPSSYFLFYNKTALNAKGIKLENKNWTWADYAQVAKEMSDPAKKVFGTWMRLNLEGFWVGMRSLGVDILDATGTKAQITSEKARPFFQMAYDLVAAKYAMPSTQGDWKAPLAASNVMMANDNGYRDSFLAEMVKDFEWETFVTPNEANMPRGVFVCDFTCPTAFSKHIDLAWEWQKGILTVEEGISRVVNARHIPLPIEAAMLPAGQELRHQYVFYIKEWLANPPLAACNPANGRTSEVFDILAKGFDAAWLGTKTLDETLKTVNDAMQVVLDKPAV
jgi:multiple sugar transport system substrate-binding protein